MPDAVADKLHYFLIEAKYLLSSLRVSINALVHNSWAIWNLGLESGIFAKKPWDTESNTKLWLVSDPLVAMHLKES